MIFTSGLQSFKSSSHLYWLIKWDYISDVLFYQELYESLFKIKNLFSTDVSIKIQHLKRTQELFKKKK